MKNKIQIVYLCLSGLVMLLVGVYIGVTTNIYYSDLNGALYAPSTNLLSDLRGMGGLILVMGAYIFSSVFVLSWRKNALFISVLIYSSFVFFRVIAVVVDGVPGVAIGLAWLIELAFATTGYALIKVRRCNSSLKSGYIKNIV